MILSGSTGDRVGRRRILQTGLVLFILGSLLSSLAPGLGWLVAFRVLQAIGGSMLNPVALSIISNTFTRPGRASPRDRNLGQRVRRQPGAGPGPDVRGYSALHAGLFILPMAAMIVVCAPLSGRILAPADRGCR